MPTLAYDVHGAEAAQAPIAVIMHGILASRRNLGSLVRRLAQAHPDWRIVNVDLRHHGDSQGFAPPDTVHSCAADLAQLAQTVGAPRVVIGHSFGGKVALVYGRDFASPQLREVWSLDSSLGLQEDGEDNDVRQVIAHALRLPMPAADHEVVKQHFLSGGFSPMLSGWMTTNVRRLPAPQEGFTWRFNVSAVQTLLGDYFQEDLWPWFEHLPAGLRVNVLQAQRSDRWPAEIVARLDAIGGDLHRVLLPNAGHWVHVDNPDGLFAELSASLTRAGA